MNGVKIGYWLNGKLVYEQVYYNELYKGYGPLPQFEEGYFIFSDSVVCEAILVCRDDTAMRVKGPHYYYKMGEKV